MWAAVMAVERGGKERYVKEDDTISTLFILVLRFD